MHCSSPFPLSARLIRRLVRLLAAVVHDDRALLSTVKLISMWDKPRARKHLNHFLRGDGTPIPMATEELLTADDGVMRVCFTDLKKQLRAGRTCGCIAIPQWKFSNRDWRYAIGSVCVQWTKLRDELELSFRERYAWAPSQGRPTQAIHQAASRLCRQGAREYEVVGIPCTVSADRVCAAKPVGHSLRVQRIFL